MRSDIALPLMFAQTVGAIVCEHFYNCRRRGLQEASVVTHRDLSSSLLGHCQHDCDSDSDCAPGLLCADDHKDELLAAGYDERTAYCNVSIGFSEVCFDPNMIANVNFTASSAASTQPGLGECEHDCDEDSDCASGLLCADEHKDESLLDPPTSREAHFYLQGPLEKIQSKPE